MHPLDACNVMPIARPPPTPRPPPASPRRYTTHPPHTHTSHYHPHLLPPTSRHPSYTHHPPTHLLLPHPSTSSHPAPRRYASHAPYWQFVLWARALALTAISEFYNATDFSGWEGSGSIPLQPQPRPKHSPRSCELHSELRAVACASLQVPALASCGGDRSACHGTRVAPRGLALRIPWPRMLDVGPEEQPLGRPTQPHTRRLRLLGAVASLPWASGAVSRHADLRGPSLSMRTAAWLRCAEPVADAHPGCQSQATARIPHPNPMKSRSQT